VAHEVERRVGALMGSPPHALDGGVKIERKAAAPAAGAPAAGAPAAAEGFRHVADGMHIDTHKASQRWATCLIYLTTLDEGDGGATVFPLAGDSTPDALVADARFLAGSECTHTDIASHGQESDRGERSPLVTAARRLVDAGEAARSCRGRDWPTRPATQGNCRNLFHATRGRVDRSPLLSLRGERPG
jgi:hypothetical protein